MRRLRIIVAVATATLVLPTGALAQGTDHYASDWAGASVELPQPGGTILGATLIALTGSVTNAGQIVSSNAFAEAWLTEYDPESGEIVFSATCQFGVDGFEIWRLHSASLRGETTCSDGDSGALAVATDVSWTAHRKLSERGHAGGAVDEQAHVVGTLTVNGREYDLGGAFGHISHQQYTDPLATGRFHNGGGGGGPGAPDGTLDCFGDAVVWTEQFADVVGNWSRSGVGTLHASVRAKAQLSVQTDLRTYTFVGPLRFNVALVPGLDDDGPDYRSFLSPVAFVAADGTRIDAYYEFLLTVEDDPRLGLSVLPYRITCGPTIAPPVE